MVPGRCPRCGTSFWVAHAAGKTEVGWAFCPHCGQPTPSLPPRASPPLFSWEVYRRFYPEPHWPRSPTPGVRRTLVILALISGIALLGVGGAFGYLGSSDLSPGAMSVSGQVLELNGNGTLVPAPAVLVSLTGIPGGSTNTTFTDPSGAFTFTGVPAGEHQLRALYVGFRISQMEIFLSPSFTAPTGNTTDLQVTLLPGPSTAVYDQPFAPFPDLETYLAYVLSASVMELLGGAVALWGAWALWRQHSVTRGVVGAGAAVLSPLLGSVGGFQILFLAVDPFTVLVGAIAFLAGSLGLATLLLAQRPLDGVEIPPPAA